MSSFLPPDGPVAPVPPLNSLTTQGEPLKRTPNVETQLGRIRAIPPSKRMPFIPRMYDECLCHFIRHGKAGDEQLYSALSKQLTNRIKGHVRWRTRRRKELIVESLLMTVEMQILEPLFKGEPEECLDFLEVGFAKALQSRLFNAIRGHKRSVLGKRGWMRRNETGEDGHPFDPLELVPDTGAGPEDIAIGIHTMHKAAKSVDPEQWQALEMHYIQGVPIQSADPEKQDMVRELDATEGEIRHRIRYGLRAIRRALLPPQPRGETE